MTRLRAWALALLAITFTGCASPISRHPEIAERVQNLIPVVEAIASEPSQPDETFSVPGTRPQP